jgi:BirA family biotin operon repressor/biotin-[acetyl-CoA-carboxylase] ligase
MLGTPLQHLQTTDSTNRIALDWSDAPHGAAVIADEQTGGRGRLGRSWSSPAGKGLYLSLVLRLDNAVSLAPLSLIVGLAIANALEPQAGVKIRLKWPNDILLKRPNGELFKIGGILCEGRGEVIVVGIGLNLNHDRGELPERPLFPASSLKLETGRDFEVSAVLPSLFKELEECLNTLQVGQWEKLRHDFQRKCIGLGEVVRVKTETGQLIGIFESINEEGALLLRTADGLQRIVAGDVSYFD